MTSQKVEIIGVGSPIMDLLAHVSDDFVSENAGTKGGMELVDNVKMEQILSQLDEFPKLAAGGSAANTIFALAKLGISAGFVGKIGIDTPGKEYINQLTKIGGLADGFKYCPTDPTARCLSLVTPDSERTLRTCLSAAANLMPDEISEDDFAGSKLVHIEGYLLFNKELIEKVLKSAQKAGCLISLDLGSFEIVNAMAGYIAELLEEYVDIVFANEDEAEAFAKTSDPQKALELFSEHCKISVVKLGADGALIRQGEQVYKIAAIPIENVVDTTGAGDFWAAGFLYGYLNVLSMELCGQMGSILGGNVVSQLGAELSDDKWNVIEKEFEKLKEAKL